MCAAEAGGRRTHGAGRVLAIDLGGSKLEMGVVSAQGQVLFSRRLSLVGQPYTPENLVRLMAETAAALEAEHGPLNAGAVGVSIPGPYDPARRMFLQNFSTGIRNWPILDDLERQFGLPAFGDNDVNACAVAEKRFGSCRDTTDFLWVTLSYGCGGALYLNDALYRGAHHMAGEVGHIAVERDSPALCGCGILGDLEAESSGTGIGRRYRQLKGLTPQAGFASREVGELARAGDALAQQAFGRAGRNLGRVLAMAANMLDLQKAVVGGGVAVYDWALLRPQMEAVLAQELYPTFRQTFSVEQTALGYHASLLGAAALAITGN